MKNSIINVDKNMVNIIVLCWCMLVVSGTVKDPGFDLFFKTNLDEMNDAPIYFDKPLPEWLRGTLIRNGLGRFEMGERRFLHTFDGFGKLSSWSFPGNGSAFFSTRFLQSDFYKDSVKSNDVAPYLMFEGVTPDFNEAEKVTALVRGIDNMNVNIYRFRDGGPDAHNYVALNDFWKVYTFDPHDLSTITSVTADIPYKKNTLLGGGHYEFLSFLSSAHPLPEHGGSSHFTYVSSVSIVPWIKSKISLVRINSINGRELVAQWTVERVPYMHSFSVTQNHVLFFASPFYVNVAKMVESAEPFESLDWYPDEQATVYVVNIHTGKVVTLKTENMFSMHHVNAFERSNGDIVVDVATYKNPDFVKNLQLSILMDPSKRDTFDTGALLKRYIINVTSRSVEPVNFKPSTKVPFSTKLDMPVINENYRHSEYCFVYGIVLKKDNVKLSNIAIVKKNVCGEEHLDGSWFLEGHYPVEPWFVPSPENQSEDDGVLLVPVLDGHKNSSYIAVIDARTMELTNSAYLPTVVPYSLHGRLFEDL